MLKITNDGRKLALDQRLIDPDLPDDPDSKVNICVGKIFEIWEQTMPQRSAQLVFCDLSTPKAGVFNVYDDMKAKLIERGIPETEIAFIHEANTDARKTELSESSQRCSSRADGQHRQNGSRNQCPKAVDCAAPSGCTVAAI